MIKIIQPEKIFASNMGVKALAAHFPGNQDIAQIIPLKTGDTLDLGNRTIQFIETKMVHWPDSMFSYLIEEKLLFSQDGFGMHIASQERFADQIPKAVILSEASKYFANILLLYKQQIIRVLDQVNKLGIEFDIIAPDHGPIWREAPDQILKLYKKWCEQKPTGKLVIVYDTMWQSTGLMARAISEGAAKNGLYVKVMCLASDHRSDIVTELLDAGAVIVGSPTLNNNIFPTVADFLVYLKGLKPKNLIGFAFGSYGWSGESIKQIENYFDEMGIEKVLPPIKAKYVPDTNVLSECYQHGASLAEKLKELI
jgi:flavorubredoxin